MKIRLLWCIKRFIVIALLTFVNSPFLSAKIKVKQKPKPEPTELFTWQQNVARDAWLKKSKSLNQEKINKIIQQYKPHKEANKEPVQPVEKKAKETPTTKTGIWSSFAQWIKRKGQKTVHDAALEAFLDAQLLQQTDDSFSTKTKAYVTTFMEKFFKLDDKAKIELMQDASIPVNNELNGTLFIVENRTINFTNCQQFAQKIEAFLEEKWGDLPQHISQTEAQLQSARQALAFFLQTLDITKISQETPALERQVQNLKTRLETALETRPKIEKELKSDLLHELRTNAQYATKIRALKDRELTYILEEYEKNLNKLYFNTSKLKEFATLKEQHDSLLKTYEAAVAQAGPVFDACRKFIAACDRLTRKARGEKVIQFEESAAAPTRGSIGRGETIPLPEVTQRAEEQQEEKREQTPPTQEESSAAAIDAFTRAQSLKKDDKNFDKRIETLISSFTNYFLEIDYSHKTQLLKHLATSLMSELKAENISSVHCNRFAQEIKKLIEEVEPKSAEITALKSSIQKVQSRLIYLSQNEANLRKAITALSTKLEAELTQLSSEEDMQSLKIYAPTHGNYYERINAIVDKAIAQPPADPKIKTKIQKWLATYDEKLNELTANTEEYAEKEEKRDQLSKELAKLEKKAPLAVAYEQFMEICEKINKKIAFVPEPIRRMHPVK